MRNVIVKQTEKKGKGIFAAKNFKKGDIVLRMDTRKTIPKKEISKLSKDDKNHLGYIGEGRYFVISPPERFLNHSCNPNVYDKTGTLIVLRNIKKGEEMCIDYAISGFDNWKMICHCGSKNCRKIVYGDFKKLNTKLRKKYEPYLEEWYKNEFL